MLVVMMMVVMMIMAMMTMPMMMKQDKKSFSKVQAM